MKLNPDCIRDILIAIEEYPEPMSLSLQEFSEKLPTYNSTEIYYCCLRLYEANYINLNFFNISSKNTIRSIGDLTFFGHEFLEHIRNEKTWDKAKPILSKVGSFSFDVIKDVTAKIITEAVKNSFM